MGRLFGGQCIYLVVSKLYRLSNNSCSNAFRGTDEEALDRLILVSVAQLLGNYLKEVNSPENTLRPIPGHGLLMCHIRSKLRRY